MSQINPTTTTAENQLSEPTTSETKGAPNETGNANGHANSNDETPYCLVVGNLMESLECNICTDILTPPVRMCRNGHSICSSCLNRTGICGFCESGFSKARNYTMENILNTCSVPCEFQKNGCAEVILLAKYAAHINGCPMNPNPIPEIPPVRARRVPMTSNNSNSSSITSSPLASPQRRRLVNFYDDEEEDWNDDWEDDYLMAVPYTVHRRRRPHFQEVGPTFPRFYETMRPVPTEFLHTHTPNNRSGDHNSSVRNAFLHSNEGIVSGNTTNTFPSNVHSVDEGSMNVTFPSPSFMSIHHSTPRDNNNTSRQNTSRQMRRRAAIPSELPSASSSASASLNTTPTVTQSIGYFYPSNTPRSTFATSTTGNPFSTLVATTNSGSFFSNAINTGNASPLRRSNFPDVPYRPMSSTVGPSTYTNRSSANPATITLANTNNNQHGSASHINNYNPVGLRRSSNNNNNNNNNSIPSVIPLEYRQVTHHHPHATPFRVICSTPNPINSAQSSYTPRVQTRQPHFINISQQQPLQRLTPLSSFRLISGDNNNTVPRHPDQYLPSSPSTSSLRTLSVSNATNISIPQRSNRNTMESTITVEPSSPSTQQQQQQQQQVPNSSDHTYNQSMSSNSCLSNDSNNNWNNHFRRLYTLGIVNESPTRNEEDFDMTEVVDTSSSSAPSGSSSSTASSVLAQTGEDIIQNRQNVRANEITSTEQTTNQRQNNNTTNNNNMITSTNVTTTKTPTSSTEATINYPIPQQNLNQSRYHSLFLRSNSNNNSNNNSNINESNDSSSEQEASFVNADNNNSTVSYDADVEDYMDVGGEGSRTQCQYCKIDGLSALSKFCQFCFRSLQP